MATVSIILPVIRPDQAHRVALIAIERSGLPDRDVELVMQKDTDRIGCPMMVKRLVDKATMEYIAFLGDDTDPQEGWLRYALEDMNSLPDEIGVVGLPDGTDRTLPTHWVAHRAMLGLLDGEFFHTGYQHCFCDMELMERSKAMGRFCMASKALVLHNHPMLTDDTPSDEDYERVYGAKVFNADRALYLQRKNNGWVTPERKCGVAFPDVGLRQYTDFQRSWSLLSKPALQVYQPTYPPGTFPRDLAIVRNGLAIRAMEDGCTHLIMMDTDQVYYDTETIHKLINANKDVCSAVVHRRWPPFDPILMRGKLGAYKPVPDDEAFSGDLIRIDATGCGCICYDMRVFRELDPPWFDIDRTDEKGKPIGEDIWLSHRIRAAGFEMWADTSIKIGHITTMEVNRDWYRLYNALPHGERSTSNGGENHAEI